jgi:hypothetical protein
MTRRRQKGSRYTPKLLRCWLCGEAMEGPEAPPPGIESSGPAHRTCIEDMAEVMRDGCECCAEGRGQGEDLPLDCEEPS